MSEVFINFVRRPVCQQKSPVSGHGMVAHPYDIILSLHTSFGMKKLTLLVLCWNMLFWGSVGATAQSDGPEANYNVIPLPHKVALTQQAPFVMGQNTVVSYEKRNPALARNARFLSQYIKDITGLSLPTRAGRIKSGEIHLAVDENVGHGNTEAYEIEVTDANVRIVGASAAGVFYGIQTLRKSIPLATEGQGGSIVFPAGRIADAPRFSYRGGMLDVSRHFFTTDEVKRYIDILALHNINHFHWHLTDDQGWRVEIKKYPRLIEVASRREETVIGHNSGRYDGTPYGGYYTQEQIKEIVDYAAQRYITIVPEIDLPGHQQAALAAYPELGCTGGPYKVWTMWGVSDNVICAGNEQAMVFLENVLDEIMDLFPSSYIHIGGDECPKTQWKKCAKCQQRIKDEHISGDNRHSAEDYLQSYVMARMEQFVERRGRHIIGWDEILEGKLAPGATVMSWRGMGGGIEAAKQHHNVIMTPNEFMYFNYYQSADTKNEPIAIGGYIPIEKVYGFEPTKGFPEENKHYVIGVQANLWTEYITSMEGVEYMLLPRMAALSEIQWTQPEQKDYAGFLQRMVHQFGLYDSMDLNYATHLFDVHATRVPDLKKHSLTITFSTLGDAKIYYTLDGSEPNASSTCYQPGEPLVLHGSADIKAVAIRKGGVRSRVFADHVRVSKSSMRPITLKYPPHPTYAYQGAPMLVDGKQGSGTYKNGTWLGFQGNDLDATIDLQEPTEFRQLCFNANMVKGDWILLPSSVSVSVSDDGEHFREVASKVYPAEVPQNAPDGNHSLICDFEPQKARYVKVVIKGRQLPEWHAGAGHPAFIFVDELSLY